MPAVSLPDTGRDVTDGRPDEGTLSEVAKQVFLRFNERKGLLVRRALLAVWPILLTLLVSQLVWVWTSPFGAETASLAERFWGRPALWGLVGAMAIASAVYAVLASAVLAIERAIWIDAHFDGKSLTPRESLRAARRLIPSAARVWFWSLYRFWLAPFAFLAAAALAAALAARAGSAAGDSATATIVVVAVVTFLVWAFVTGVRLRNLWFVFLDCHDGVRADTETISAQMSSINHEMKTKEFAKYVGAAVGIDSVTALVRSIAPPAAARSQPDALASGGWQATAGESARVYADALAAQAQSFARAIAAYVFYRAARQRLGLGQAVNERVYALARE